VLPTGRAAWSSRPPTSRRRWPTRRGRPAACVLTRAG